MTNKLNRLKKEACECCGISDSRVLVIHHIIPKHRGGNDDSENTMTVCGNCHLIIHSSDTSESRLEVSTIGAQHLFEKMYQKMKQQYGNQQQGGLA